MSAYNSRGVLATRNLPLHKIPHYYFSSVAGSTKSLLIFIFFPELHLESQYEHTNYLSKTVNDSTLASYLPTSEETVSRGVTAVAEV
ncbi:hypothetical protein PMIN06_012446 [Paraphaeosphaeria minitans]